MSQHLYRSKTFYQKGKLRKLHCLKSVRIESYSGPYFPTFGLNMKRYSVSLRIQSKCWKIRTRITPITDTFYAVLFQAMFNFQSECEWEAV